MNAVVETSQGSANRPAVRQVSVNGYIDAITNNRIYGWAWDAQNPDARITIHLQANGKIVGMLEADQPREDLIASGIGDGCHAFEAEIPDGVSPTEIAVLALCPVSGQTVELAQRGTAGHSQANGGAELRGVVDTLTQSHGFVHRKLMSLTATLEELQRNGMPDSAGPAVALPAEADYAPMSRLQTLEEAVLRFDNLVKAQGAEIDSLRDRPLDQMARLLAGTALVLSVTALVIALLS